MNEDICEGCRCLESQCMCAHVAAERAVETGDTSWLESQGWCSCDIEALMNGDLTTDDFLPEDEQVYDPIKVEEANTPFEEPELTGEALIAAERAWEKWQMGSGW